MSLFKRILLSLFPDNMVSQNINPASMFVSFISSKQFFSVVNRRMVENYKLNLFDISLDPFEAKLGFGEQPIIKIKDIDFYYSYCVVANLNGYRFFNVSTMTTSIVMAIAVMLREFAKNHEKDYSFCTITTIYLLAFIFLSRMKVFPSTEREENVKRFIDVFFSFYRFSFEQSGQKIDEKKFQAVKNGLLGHLQIFFFLFYYYKKLNNIFFSSSIPEKEYYNRIFYDELRKGDLKDVAGEFVTHYENYISSPIFSSAEKILMDTILPADVLMRYMFDGKDGELITDHILSAVYDKKMLEKYFSSFLKDGHALEEFLLALTNYQLFKKNYFNGINTLFLHKFKTQQPLSTAEEIDDFMSAIGEGDTVGFTKIPERVKEESHIMERLMNFYVMYIGGFRTARGDTFFMRIFKPRLFGILKKSLDAAHVKENSLYYYGSLLYNYSKNVFYYKYAYDNIKAGKEKFYLPFRSTFREVYSNMVILKLFDEHFLTILLEEINPKDLKIFLRQKDILDLFKKHAGKKISSLVKLSDADLLIALYGGMASFLNDTPEFLETITKELTKKDIGHIKENLYNLDFWIWMSCIDYCVKNTVGISAKYSDSSIMGIFSTLKETIFGFLLYLTYLNQMEEKMNKNYAIDILIKVYIIDLLNLSDEYLKELSEMIKSLYEEYEPIMKKRIDIDDNKNFLHIGLENWVHFTEGKKADEIAPLITGEDMLRFRGYLKNIRFYNQRFLIPKD